MRLSSLVFLPALALAMAAPALADVSITKGKQLCKSAVMAQTPAPEKVSFDDGNDVNKVTTSAYSFSMRVTTAGSKGRVVCTVDRAAGTASVAAAK